MNDNVDYKIKSLKLGLDKLTLTVTPHDMTPYGEFVKVMKSIAMMNEEIVFAVGGAQTGYRVAVRLKVPSVPATAWPLLQIGPFLKTAYFRLELNPNRLGQDGIAAMKHIIDTNTPHGWPLFMKLARASRIDVNIDAQDLPLNRVLLSTKYPRTTEVWSQKGNLEAVGIGEAQTFYLGQKGKSKNIYRVYGLDAAKIDVGCTVATRFESVDSTTHPSLPELHAYAFPYDKLVVHSALAATPPGWHGGMWNMFIRFAANHGLNVALQHLTDKQRKQALKSLAATPIAEFDLAKTWSQWPALITSFGLQQASYHGSYLPGFSSASLAA